MCLFVSLFSCGAGRGTEYMHLPCDSARLSAHHLRSMDHAVEHGTGHTAHLDALEESVNRQIDADIRVLLDNFREMIHLSRVCFDICMSTYSRLARKIIST